jgi:hypothetical protein
MATKEGDIFVKVASHRARSRLTAYVKVLRPYCSLQRGVGKGVYRVTKAELAEIRGAKVKGVTKFKDKGDLSRCWMDKHPDKGRK